MDSPNSQQFLTPEQVDVMDAQAALALQMAQAQALQGQQIQPQPPPQQSGGGGMPGLSKLMGGSGGGLSTMDVGF